MEFRFEEASWPSEAWYEKETTPADSRAKALPAERLEGVWERQSKSDIILNILLP